MGNNGSIKELLNGSFCLGIAETIIVKKNLTNQKESACSRQKEPTAGRHCTLYIQYYNVA